MNIKDLLTKAITGTALTVEEKAFVETFDIEGEKNAAAAAARRKSEEAAQALRDQLDTLNGQLETKSKENMTAAERLQSTIDALTGKVTGLEKAKADAEAKIAASQRKDHINKLRTAKGIQFLPGVDPEIAEYAWDKTFADVPDLASLTTADVDNRIVGFVTKNSAIVQDKSGGGSGLQTRPGVVATVADTPAARAAEMKAKGLL